MKLYYSMLVGVLVLIISPTANSQTIYTWLGTSSDLSVDTNWSPTGVPSTWTSDTATFNSSGTTKTGLTPGGTAFSAASLTFSGATYAFATIGGGDSIGIGDGAVGSLTLSSGANVNFSSQSIAIGNSMDWGLSGNSVLTSTGVVDVSTYALNVLYGVSETNIASLTTLAFSGSGAITVANWGGTTGVYGGSNNQLRFSTDPTAYLSKISFTGYAGTTAATQNMGAYYEVVPVPEPATWLLLAVGLTTVVVFRRRRAS